MILIFSIANCSQSLDSFKTLVNTCKLYFGRGFSLHILFTLGRDIWAQIGRGKLGQAGEDPLWVPTGPPGLLEDRSSGPVANPGLPLGFVIVAENI